ncbi:uncharacterized protein LOC117635405 [Prunus dulcis]|uniref:uncharacterized protein LOC117635405 n=1 Tax=Prunus dulcis TaxID=3755 RepID=UPI001482E6BE|nr:uncharacterized protein LOC117635405 [Prunus dulcis]
MSEKLKGKVERSGNSSSEAKECGLPLEKLNLGPRKKLLVLSLGGLLCHRVHRYERANIPRFRYVDASYGSFLCYLDIALDCVMKGLRSKLVFAWDQVKCTDSGFKTLEKRDKPLFLKELKKVWEGKCSKTRSSSTGKYSSSNTLLMDNQPYKALLNPPHTAICPAEYKVDQVDDMALGPMGVFGWTGRCRCSFLHPLYTFGGCKYVFCSNGKQCKSKDVNTLLHFSFTFLSWVPLARDVKKDVQSIASKFTSHGGDIIIHSFTPPIAGDSNHNRCIFNIHSIIHCGCSYVKIHCGCSYVKEHPFGQPAVTTAHFD